jgi:transglutaminase-like putative cysteine protease
MGAVVSLALVATITLSAVLAVSLGHLVATAALAAIPALVATGLMAPRCAVATMVPLVPVTLLAAGVPAGALAPEGWRRLLAGLASGSAHALTSGGPLATGPAALASVMLLAGALWTAGAVLGASSVGLHDRAPRARLRASFGFVLLAAPWLAALSVTAPDHSAWQGAVVLVAGVLWFCSGRAALSLAVVAAVAATMLARAVGPSSPWFGLAARPPVSQPFRTLETDSTYGPLTDRRTGATMLTVTAPAPALWRMQTLDYADGRWIVDGSRLPELREPAARREDVQVRVVGLREDLAVAPGRIERVSAHGRVASIAGEGMLLMPMPAPGASYRVQAADVHATPAQLSHDRAPLDAAAEAYTRLVPVSAGATALQQLGWLSSLIAILPQIREAPDPRVVALARRLTEGTRTEWEKVERVERYLVASGRFRYTTDVPDPGPQPLVDFLLRTHAGYCQQFAGAAALLLRIAGVPARVVSGFATGKQVGPHRYAVRDLDAHQWIEVYFEGYGWVPFNPTPAADPALISGAVDPLAPSPDPARAPYARALGLTLITLAAAAALWSLRRRHSTRASGDWFWRVARRAAGELEPSTTLGDIRELLAARVGPRTAAIASRIEWERFAVDPLAEPAQPRVRVARALVGDLGPLGSLIFWVHPRHHR